MALEHFVFDIDETNTVVMFFIIDYRHECRLMCRLALKYLAFG